MTNMISYILTFLILLMAVDCVDLSLRSCKIYVFAVTIVTPPCLSVI